MYNQLLQVAKELKINLIGVSFHVGSGCQCADAYVRFPLAPNFQ